MDSIAKRRARASITGALPLDAAKILVERGTKPAGNGVTWSADPKILAPRFRLSEEVQKSLVKGIRCPHAVVVVQDGLFKAGSLGLPLFSMVWRFVVATGILPPPMQIQETMLVAGRLT